LSVRAWALFGALLVFLTACSSASPAPAATTTTAAQGGAQAATTTTLNPVAPGGEGFRTRTPGVLVIGTERVLAPWYTGPSEDEITGGFEYRLGREIGSRLGVPVVKVVQTSVVKMMTGQDCGCDVMISGLAITDSRARSLDLSEPYVAADQSVVVPSGVTVPTLADLAQLRLGVALRNPVGLDILRTRVKPAVAPMTVVNEGEALNAVKAGTLDGVVLDTLDALALVAIDPTVRIAGQLHSDEQYAVALGLGSPNTALVNDVIRDMRDDGTVDALLRTYLGTLPADVPFIPS
jgi:ABC-type amino acid transport substrate-binding protein